VDVLLADREGLRDVLADVVDRIGAARAGPRAGDDAVFSDPFVRAHTAYGSFEAFRADAPADLDVLFDRDAPGAPRRVNEFVDDVTEFETWEEMESRAAQAEIVDRLLSATA